MPNFIINKICNKPEFLELVERVWNIIYIEGSSPDIGRRRENFVKLALKYALGLTTEPPEHEMERQLDFYLVEGEKRHPYSFKSTDSHTLKVAWDGNVTEERLANFVFTTPILMLYASSTKIRESGFYLFEVDDLTLTKFKLGDNFWSMPGQETNPRGFGVTGKSLAMLLELAKEKGNFVKVNLGRGKVDEEKYWAQWYAFMTKVAEEVVLEQPPISDDKLRLFP